MAIRPVPNGEASDEDFALLRALFERGPFNLEGICNRLHITRLHHIDPTGSRIGEFGPIDTVQAALLSLFVEGKPLTKAQVHDLLGDDGGALLERLTLVRPLDDDQITATVALYPIEHLYIASDRYNSADDKPFEGFDDIVYPCLFETTDRFIRMIPREDLKPDAIVLDLCSGTGVAGLLQARHAKHVYAFDIAERSTAFARFNQRMNAIPNFTALTGDLYAPAADRRFDCIVVHPPYQPVFKRQQIFNSGGVDGEEITRRCVEQSYARLNPGGRLYCTAQITAREQSVAERVRQWIQEPSAGATDFDVAHYITKIHELEGFASKAILNAGGTMYDFRLWMRDFARLGVRQLDYGLLMVERHGSDRKPFTITRRARPQWHRLDFETSFAWEQFHASPDFGDRVWTRKLHANPGARLQVVHQLASQSKWEVSGYRMSVTEPFESTLEATQSLAHLISLFAGSPHAVGDCYRDFSESSASIGRPEFAEGVAAMVSEGFLLPSE